MGIRTAFYFNIFILGRPVTSTYSTLAPSDYIQDVVDQQQFSNCWSRARTLYTSFNVMPNLGKRYLSTIFPDHGFFFQNFRVFYFLRFVFQFSLTLYGLRLRKNSNGSSSESTQQIHSPKFMYTPGGGGGLY